MEINTLRALTEKEKGELDFWIDHILGFGKYYAILQSDGPFKYDRLVRGDYDRCIEGSTVEEVETRIVAATRVP